MAYISFDPENDPLKKESKKIKPLGKKWRRRFLTLLTLVVIEHIFLIWIG